MHPLAKLDHAHVWHPFTQMRDWLRREPIVIISGSGAVLRDVHGREYLDANSSIWTNLHGHNHPAINSVIKKQLGKISHSSALGLANEPASLLAQKLLEAATPQLAKVFFSDDGSTALEVAIKLAYEYPRRSRKTKRSQKAGAKPKFLSLEGAYHGDTVGAVSMGHIAMFHKAYEGLLFKTDKVMSPYCYRCPFNRAKPERADARVYRKCNWECVGKVEQKFAAQSRAGNPYAAFVFEPGIQGSAGMVPQPETWLNRVAHIARGHGALLIADEVMTGLGRACHAAQSTGQVAHQGNLFACHDENVQPDFLCVAKGLTGGYLPMAATLVTQQVFDAFLGNYDEFKTFFHGHSYTGNQLGAAASLASLKLLQSEKSKRARQKLEGSLSEGLKQLWQLPNVGDIRQVGLVAGIELVKNWRTREPFDLREQAGIRVCEAMARKGVLTRPIGNVIVIMPPYCTTASQLEKMIHVLGQSITEVFGIP